MIRVYAVVVVVRSRCSNSCSGDSRGGGGLESVQKMAESSSRKPCPSRRSIVFRLICIPPPHSPSPPLSLSLPLPPQLYTTIHNQHTDSEPHRDNSLRTPTFLPTCLLQLPTTPCTLSTPPLSPRSPPKPSSTNSPRPRLTLQIHHRHHPRKQSRPRWPICPN